MVTKGILSQPKKLESLDTKGMLEACEKMPDYCRNALILARKLRIPKKIQVSNNHQITYRTPKNILIVGMGGSAIGGEILRDWLRERFPLPIITSQEYILPAFANEDSLVITVSYSGETEETLSAFSNALSRRCMLVAISSGGRLRSYSQRLGIPHILLPHHLPAPRAAIAYTFFPLVAILEKLRLLTDIEEEILETLNILRQISKENSPSQPIESNEAKKIASEIGDTVPVIYGFRQYKAATRRLKCQFNENGKIPSRFDVFSELNHNEIVGWEAPKKYTKHYSVLFIRDPEEPPEFNRRIEITKKIITPKAEKILEIKTKGTHPLSKILSAIHLGDFISLYHTLSRGIDPTPTESIHYLKEEMKKSFNLTTKFDETLNNLK
jgi:glucose/mannose-6-phosphate isomerase